MNPSSLFIIIAAFLTPLLIPSNQLVEGKLLMTVILNDGILPTPEGYSCTDADSQIIESVVESQGGGDGDDGRKLGYPARCRDDCRGYQTGTCHVTGCKGFRRRKTQKKLLRFQSKRRMDDETAMHCATAVESMNQKLNATLSTLTPNCRPIVERMRKLRCFDDVLYAAVERFSLWNADTDTIIKEKMKDNDSYCFTNSTLNIEAVANACVEEMELFLTGPVRASREQESASPYTTFGHRIGTDGHVNFTGRVLPIGSYTLKTVLEGSLTPLAQITFTIRNCTN